ncbi:hypothetical protein FVE85_7116 [Porphyridium purpureum]|uniref:BZIP domain-containing protein n=1 Tax=Porphyridium purpureum TaxID=35688 RepID=A0A5J4Z6N3_PORPP|nr:hypothetical protein FVE85_7116 [Porphyridium purpureum]|eukprot:POR5241..scf295_1
MDPVDSYAIEFDGGAGRALQAVPNFENLDLFQPLFDAQSPPDAELEREPESESRQHVTCVDGTPATNQHLDSFHTGAVGEECGNEGDQGASCCSGDDGSELDSNADSVKIKVGGQLFHVDPKTVKDLSGSTARAARRMSAEERSVMLMKRKLRNRESAKRSRAKRLQTIHGLKEQMRNMSREAQQLRIRCEAATQQSLELRLQNEELKKSVAVVFGLQNPDVSLKGEE